ncbi:MAG: hypothetical protein JJE04_23820 [Acidobacteriia bacterium]|nr:hypothetical protein [Terriglobia bacterium]
MDVLDAEAVRAQLDRIVSSVGFVQSDRLCRFLKFAVEAKLGGDGERMKEYVLGREVFDRGEDYDPRLDPIVRVEARRLRAKLEEYYSGAGRQDPIRITVPKGGYEPVFGRQESHAIGARLRMAAIGVVAAAVVAAAVLYVLRPGHGGMVLVMPASWYWGEPAETEDLEKALAELVAAELTRTGAARVIAWPSVSRYHLEHKADRGVGRALGASRVLLVSVRGGADSARVTVFLFDALTDQKMWVEDYLSRRLVGEADRAEMARVVSGEFSGK